MWGFRWSHLSHWAWNKGYHRYRQVCFIPWPTPRNWQRGRLRTKLYEMISIWLSWTFHSYVATFQQHLHMEYISQLIRYSRACGSYQDVLDIGLLLTRKLLNKGFLLVRLKSSIRKCYGRNHDLVDRCGISVSQMTTGMFQLSRSLPRSWLITGFVTRLTRRGSLVEQEQLTLPEHLSSPPVLYVCFVDSCLSFFFRPLFCLFFFDIRIRYLQTIPMSGF